MSKFRKDNTSYFVHIIMSSVIILVAILVWPKNINNTQSNEINKNETQIRITVKRINIREKPTITSKDIGDVYLDEIYTVLEYVDNEGYYWYQIRTNQGIEGFIASDPNEEYVEVISGVIDREGPKIHFDDDYLVFEEGIMDTSDVTCTDNYSKCTISYEDNRVSLLFTAKDERGNETTKEIPYYKVYKTSDLITENNKNLNANYSISSTGGKRIIKASYVLNKFISKDDKSINYNPVAIFYNSEFEEIETIVVKFNEQDVDSSCLNNSSMSLKNDYIERDLSVSSKICINFSIQDNANIEYFRIGIEGVENYNNDSNYLANYYSKIYKW